MSNKFIKLGIRFYKIDHISTLKVISKSDFICVIEIELISGKGHVETINSKQYHELKDLTRHFL